MTQAQDASAERLRRLFSFLVSADDGTAIMREDSPYFGDVALTLQAKDIELRLVCERGRYSAEIRRVNSDPEWFDLSAVQRLLSSEDIPDEVPIESQAQFLKDHGDEVQVAFDTDQWPLTRRQLQAIERERTRRRLGLSREKE